MPTYKYEGAYASGEKVSGVVEAVSQTDAVNQIRQSCEIVLSLKEVPRAAARDPLARFQKITAKSLALTCQQFAIILKAGLPLVQTVDLVAGQCGDKNLTALLRQVSEDVSNGWSLSYSFEQRGARSLPITFRETVRAGEESGDLLSSFQRMADYFERMNKTRESVVSALTYPTFVIVVAVIVVSIIMGYAVPTFTNMFESLSIELPWVTKALIAVSGFFQKYTLLLIALLALAVFAVKLYGTTEKGGPALARTQLKLPIIGEIVRMSGASQFSHTMSTLLTAGMPILQAIDVSGRTVTNLCLSGEVLATLPGVEGGRPLGECMSYAKELPPMLTQMTAVGEATGSLESTLKVLADYYDNEVDVRVKRALSLLEPAIIVALSIFVVFILMAVYLPMFSMYSAI
ncbi:MAG: type II secretion system F family protein [Dysosmobacter sp.]|nr:type II secretion system F family protein [Dysosmobacter sp.]